MLKDTLIRLFERDLNRLKAEIDLYRTDGDLWITKGEISNSGGNLCLHLLGNLNHFIGAGIGETGFIRNRDREFSDKEISREILNEEITKTIETVKTSLDKLSAEDFKQNFPVEKDGEIVKMDFMLVHLLAHLSYHLGQINYHRRLISQI